MIKKFSNMLLIFIKLLVSPIAFIIIKIRYLIKKRSTNNFIDIHPVTIVSDRYHGTYSGGKYLAFNLNADQLPDEIDDGDIDCMKYWVWVKHTNQKVGVGSTPIDAYHDLLKKINSK